MLPGSLRCCDSAELPGLKKWAHSGLRAHNDLAGLSCARIGHACLTASFCMHKGLRPCSCQGSFRAQFFGRCHILLHGIYESSALVTDT